MKPNFCLIDWLIVVVVVVGLANDKFEHKTV